MNIDDLKAGAHQAWVDMGGTWRPGQAAFNVLLSYDLPCAEALRASECDPFHDDGRLPAFWGFVRGWRACQRLSKS